jgi:hypothetical protein
MPGGRTCAKHGALQFQLRVSIGLALKAPPHVHRSTKVPGLALLVSAVVADGLVQGPLQANACLHNPPSPPKHTAIHVFLHRPGV